MGLDLIIVRILPNPPTDATIFQRYLDGLTIDAYDQNIIDFDPNNAPTGYQELKLGTASGVVPIVDGELWSDILQPMNIQPPARDQNKTLPNSIIQHVVFDQPNQQNNQHEHKPAVGILKAVATAVIVVDIPRWNPGVTTHEEYPVLRNPPPNGIFGYDLRLDIKRNGVLLDAPDIEWNATYYTVPDLSPFVIDYMGIASNGTQQPVFAGYPFMSQPSLYAIIPDAPSPLPPGTAGILLKKDGTPPNFDDLLNAVNMILRVYNLQTGTNLQNLTSPLTEQQCNDIAYEIAYNRAWFPLPPPVGAYPRPEHNTVLEDLYTAPSNEHNQTRSQFEGNLTSYHSKLNAMAMKLSNYIFAASAAIQAERSSAMSPMVAMTFPLTPAIANTKAVTTQEVVLTSWDNSVTAPTTHPISPAFTVPAAYFYALGYQLSPTMDSTHRYNAYVNTTPESLTRTIQGAVNIGVLNASESTVAQPTNFTVNTNQALRRLAALSPNVVTSSQPMVYVNNVLSIVNRWLDYLGLDSAFWNTAEFDSGEYLNLIIQVIAGGDTALSGAIAQAPLVPPAPLSQLQVANQLPLITTTSWRSLFTGNNPPPLPAYTAPGSTRDRINAFIRKLQQIFSVGWEAPTTPSAGSGSVPMLSQDPTENVLDQFLAANSFSFDSPWNDAQVDVSIFNDGNTQQWVKQMLKELWTLVQVTNFTTADPPQTALTPDLRMSYMEALHSRGFVSADRITSILTAQFIVATTGTVIETKDASTIHQLACGLPNNGPVTGPEPAFGFQPANPGDLVNCIPPANLCPFGHMEYLHQMLQEKSNKARLCDAVSARRGTVGGLHTTMANLEIDVPEVDLVIESLEALGSGGTSDSTTITPAVGAVYDTSPDLRKVFAVSREDACVKDDALLAAIPEHSSPAVKIDKAAVYDKLKTCLTSPSLPFSRQLEISRRYLCSLGTDTFETMRRFRSDITEFAIDPATDPVDFQKQVWRFPVRIEIGIEYLGISQEEYKTLYSRDLSGGVIANLYGFDPSTEYWSNQVLILEAFLSATGLSYCELLCLQKSGWVLFEIIPTTKDQESDASPGNSKATPASSAAMEDIDGNHTHNNTTPKPSDEPGSDNPGFLPDCPPCCLSQWRLSFGDVNLDSVLARVILFVRLWRTLNSGCRDKISFSRLADICTVLELFDLSGHVNPGFIQQLPSLIMLHDFFCLPWSDYSKKSKSGGQSPPVPGSSGTELLALWSKSHSTTEQWDWAESSLLHAVQRRAETEFHCARREPGFLKIVGQNLDPLSKLAGFSDSNPWYQSPTCTIRFAEVLTKIYASNFTVGEILFLFTVEHHLDGDDPFPLASRLETFDRPLKLSDDQLCNSLDALREKLLCVEISNEECEDVGWHKLESIIRDAGYVPFKKGDHLQGLAEHFFPETLGGVNSEKRRYSTPLIPKETSPKVWSADPCIPFHYEVSTSSSTDSEKETGHLWTTIPLREESVFRKLQVTRQLRLAEIAAVRNLYYMPRAALAPFALLFDNFGHAVEKLVQEPCEKERFAFFTRQVLLFHRRCKIISRHLAAHVKDATSDDGGCGSCGPCPRHERHNKCEKVCLEDETRLAWTILKSLIADENTASRPETTGDPWEVDDGSPPLNFEWNAQFSGNAVSAILGLIGTGLKGAMASQSGAQWTEMRGGLDAFGHERNKWNEPVPIVIPQLSILANSVQDDLVSFKNGLAFRNKDDDLLHGAEPFSLEWKGTLIVDCAGFYVFSGGRPHEQKGKPHCDGCDDMTWLVTLQRGQKKFNLLSHGNEHIPGPSFVSREVQLEKGTYAITVEFAQKDPKFDHPLDVDGETTGFQVTWEGPGTEEQCFIVPFCDLITDTKTEPLAVIDEAGGSAAQSRRFQYYSSLRDIRRTYQRAFKALLFAKNFCLDAKELYCDDISEMQYLLNNAQRFKGTSFYQVPGGESLKTASTGSWAPHHAWLDFNLLPVGDPFFPPDPGTDSRAIPSPKRQAALFNWWERMFDYTRLRDRSKSVTKKSLWLLFQEAGSEQPYLDMANLVRYLKIDPDLMVTLLNYSVAGNTVYTITGTDLLDERWTTRLWLARQHARHLVEFFFTDILEKAIPALWVADDLEVDTTVGQNRPESGLKNLVGFVQSSILNSDECASRLSALGEMNDDLRKRCRDALVAYLTQLNRVKLPDGAPITMPRQLSDLILQDVEGDLGEATTRIHDACSCVQKFVQRARIGLEPQFTVTEDFSRLWECRFASFETWVAWARRQLYGENWTQWEELKALKKGSEAGWLLEQEIPAGVETLIEPGRPLYFQAGLGEPEKKGLEPLQNHEMAVLEQHTGSTLENLRLLGTPDHHARPTLLRALIPGVSSGEDSNSKSKAAAKDTATATVPEAKSAGEQLSEIATRSLGSVPIWIESAIRLGTRFIRVAASAQPPACPYKPKDEKKCCEYCGKMHVPSIDEYYFWLHDDSAHDDNDVPQDADLQTSGDDDATAPAWDDPNQLPDLLAWKKVPIVVLFWTRVHAGQLLPLRRSAEGVRVDLIAAGDTSIKLELEGRNFDSLFLTLTGRNLDPTKASGSNPGFRYDIATDLAIVTPQVVPDTFPDSVGKGLDNFAGYPWFVYFKPHIPLAPPTPFGVALALGTKLKDSCQYEAALNWLRAAFDPLGRDNTWALCTRRIETFESKPVADELQALNAKAVVELDPTLRFRDSPCCPGVTQQPSIWRGRAVFLEYLDTLLLWADQLADAGSLEKGQQALVLLETMDHLLGDRPKVVKAHPNPILNTLTVANFVPSAPPLNPRLLKLYDEVDNRMSIMRRRVKGKKTSGCNRYNPSGVLGPDAWEISRLDGETCCDSLCPSTPCQPYRFTSIFPKATELASLVKQLASSLVSAYERGDAEYLAALRQSHERTMLDLGIDIAQFQWRAADWDVQSLGEQMQSALARLRYNRFLLDRGNVTGEAAYQTGEQTSMNSNSGGNMNDSMAETFNMIPDFAFGVAGNGVYQSTQVPIGQKMAGMASSMAKILNTTATIASTGAGLSLTQAGWQRRNEDWQHQIDLCVIEIAQIKRQILAGQRRKDVALRELNNHQRQLEHADEVMDFMRDKYSRHSMFLFLQHETSVILKGTFDLALRTARDAYQAFLFERAPTTPGSSRVFPSAADLWSGPFEGVNTGDRLDLALRRLEREYMNNNCRELELNKRISLRESFPKEFVELRLWGSCEVDIKEWRFDEDHPGLWMQRLRSVTFSVPCVAGSYTGVHARVRLLGSATRTRPMVRPAAEKCCNSKHNGKRHSCWHDKCDKDAEDPYLVHRFASSHSSAALLATSHGQDDGGLFENSMHDERYLPFEYEGAVSKWRVEMPEAHNLFDFQSLADVVVNLNYTAREGDDELRKKAIRELSFRGRSDGWWRGFEIRREFPDVWPRFEANRIDWEGGRGRACGHGVEQGEHDCGCESQRQHGHPESRHGHRRHHDHQPSNHGHDDGCRCASCSMPTPPRSASPRHHHASAHFDFPLRLRRGMFPFLSPGPPAIRITTLCIYVVLPRACVCHEACPDKVKDQDDTCACGDKHRDKKCCCPATGRHFPVLFIPPGEEEKQECRENWRSVELVPHVPPPGVIAADDDGEFGAVPDREVYQCEIGDLDLGPIGHDDLNRSMRGVIGGWEVYGHLWFPKSMGRVKEAWVLCGFEPVADGAGKDSNGCKSVGWKENGGKKRDGEMDSGERRRMRKYFSGMESD